MGVNSKNTKAEILAAYKEIEQQNKALALKLKQKQNSQQIVAANVAPSKASPTLATKTISDRNNQDIIHTIVSLEQIQGSFGGAVGDLSERLIVEATQLETVRQAIALEKQELADLHQLTEIEESTIDVLLEQYQASAQKFAAEFEQQQTSDRHEIAAAQKAWAKRQQVHARMIIERNQDYRKSQQREQEEYQYNLDLARDLEESEYEQEKKLQRQQLKETRQTLEQQWRQREQEIARQEQEYDEAKAKAIAFEEQLRCKIKQGTEEGKGIAAYQAKIKADLAAKEIEGETQNYQLRIESLEQTIKHQTIRINQLVQQLDNSLKQVQDLAVKAIEGTSNRNSFEAVKAIALEQAKTNQKGK